MKRRQDTPGQMQIDWTAKPEPPPALEPAVKLRIRRAPAFLPVPKALPAAIEAGHFGEDENGDPINPSPDEVRAIGENLAERLIDLLKAHDEVKRQINAPVCSDRARLFHEKDNLTGQFNSGLALYSESFGPEAAARMESYARHQAGKGRGR